MHIFFKNEHSHTAVSVGCDQKQQLSFDYCSRAECGLEFQFEGRSDSKHVKLNILSTRSEKAQHDYINT